MKKLIINNTRTLFLGNIISVYRNSDSSYIDNAFLMKENCNLRYYNGYYIYKYIDEYGEECIYIPEIFSEYSQDNYKQWCKLKHKNNMDTLTKCYYNKSVKLRKSAKTVLTIITENFEISIRDEVFERQCITKDEYFGDVFEKHKGGCLVRYYNKNAFDIWEENVKKLDGLTKFLLDDDWQGSYYINEDTFDSIKLEPKSFYAPIVNVTNNNYND